MMRFIQLGVFLGGGEGEYLFKAELNLFLILFQVSDQCFRI